MSFLSSRPKASFPPLRNLKHAALTHIPLRPPPNLLRTHATTQHAIPASYYRGGTSRAIMFRSFNLPSSSADRRSLFLQVMGTPDPNGRQLDGFGAGISSLSKICLVDSLPSDPNADVSYTFVGLGIETPVIDTAGNCGNMSSAVGPFAFNERLLGEGFEYMKDGQLSVRIFNVNTKKYIRSTFEVRGGQAVVAGSYEIDGVHGGGARIRLDFLDPAGAKTGKLLPTGSVVDEVEGFQVSCVDSANPMVFVRAEDVGIESTILPNEFMKAKDRLELLDRIRRKAAVKMGMVGDEGDVPRTIPKIAIVSPAKMQTTLSGKIQNGEAIDVLVRFISDEQPHRAIPLTGALCTASAARIPGTIVNKCTRQEALSREGIRIAHASGTIEVGAELDEEGNVREASVFRTAKRLMDGQVYWSR